MELLRHLRIPAAREKNTSAGEGEFDASRAELFEALGHSTRIAILHALEEKPMGFAELKRKTGIESSGLLSFHLGKLTHLVSRNQAADYQLTDQGKEAVRMIRITRSAGHNEQTIKVRNPSKRPYLVAICILLAAVIALGSAAVYQQAQIGSLSGAVQSHDPVVVYGTLAAGGSNWVSGITATSYSPRIVFTSPTGSNFTTIPNAAGDYWVTMPGGQKYVVTVYWDARLSCSTSCMSIINSTGLSINVSNVTASPATGSQGQPQTSVSGVVAVQSVGSTNAVATGSCRGNVLGLYSTTGSYSYDIFC